MRAAGYKFTDQVFDQHYIDIMEYMSDWYMVKDRENTITQTIAQAYEQWPIERIENEINRWLTKTQNVWLVKASMLNKHNYWCTISTFNKFETILCQAILAIQMQKQNMH